MRRLDEVPRIPAEEAGDPLWYPLQHYFGFRAFGVNVYTAPEAGGALIGEHDESGSEQEELYLVTEGAARFTIDGEEHVVSALGIVAVPDPEARRSAIAEEPGTTLVVVGGSRAERFDSSWEPHHFEGVPRAG